MATKWNTENNYAPSQVNGGNQWSATPSVGDMVKIAETVFNINLEKTRTTLLPQCSENNALSHRDCVESGWMYVSNDDYGPTRGDYMVFTMAYSESNLVQLAFELDRKAIWLTRAYPNSDGHVVWDTWTDLGGELPAIQAGSIIKYNSQKVDLDFEFDGTDGILNIKTIVR